MSINYDFHDVSTSGNLTAASGEFSALTVSGIHVSISGHDHAASEITFDNTLHVDDTHGLEATNVQDAIDELEYKKVNVSDLNTNLMFFPTTTASDIANHNKLVISTQDDDYDDIAQDVSTGTISSDDQIVGQLVSDSGVIVGDAGLVNITTIGNVRKASGNKNATFYFKVFKLDVSSNETEICSSDPTPEVTSSDYNQFSENALFPADTSFVVTDRIIIRYYGSPVGVGNDPTYEFQFGGDDPVRTLVPVPANVVVQSVWSQDVNNNIYYNSGNVGINTSSPNYNLDVEGSGNFSQNLFVNNVEVSVSGHTHTSSEITDFDTSVSNLLPITNKQTFTATSSQTTFVVTNGYVVGAIDVYYNGIRLISGTDFAATDGNSIVFTEPAVDGSVVEVVSTYPSISYKNFVQSQIIHPFLFSGM